MTKGIKKYRYDGEKKYSTKKFDTSDTGQFADRQEAVEEFIANLKEINKLQQKLYAVGKEGIVFIFQAMDAAGKDGVIRTVFSTMTPHGVKEFCFKTPTSLELSHDYLWRFWNALPARGNISIFNRSYYEDVLIGKVKLLYKNYAFPERLKDRDMIADRYVQINEFEKYLYDTGTRVVKIFLNVSKDEQAKRFISRIDTPKKNWKASVGDIKCREDWDAYMEAFEDMVNKTSSDDSPWYVVPSDHKWYSRLIVSRIVLDTLKQADPKWPHIEEDELEEIMACRQQLVDSIADQDILIEDTPEMFADTEKIAASIYLDEEKDKIDAKTRKLKHQGLERLKAAKDAGVKFLGTSEIIKMIFRKENNDNE